MFYVIFGLQFDIQFEKPCEKCNPWKGLLMLAQLAPYFMISSNL
jgi:hypothetical protein